MSDSVLSELDWDEGVAIPVANDENKLLEQELLATKREIAQLSNTVATTEERAHAMEIHLQHVNHELIHTTALIDAHMKDLETEEHMTLIAEREGGRLREEIRRVKNDFLNLEDRHEFFENQIIFGVEQLNDLKSQMNWDQEALEAWIEESARRDEDAITLEKYSLEDNSKIKELCLLLERLTEEAQQKRKFLDAETTETLLAQIALDKTAEDFRTTHSARLELIRQWEVTIRQMKKRDKEMDYSAAALAKVKEDIRNREQVVAEKEKFLENELQNNRELEKKIESEERQAAKLRLQCQAKDSLRTQIEDELETLKYTVERTATDLESTKGSIVWMNEEIAAKDSKLQQVKIVRGKLESKLFEAKQGVYTSENTAMSKEEVLEEEMQKVKKLDQDLRKIRDVHYKKKMEEQDVIAQEKDVASAIQGSRAANKNLAARLNKLNEESIKQQEIIYNQDFRIQHLEHHIARVSGEMNLDERKEMEAKIEKLGDVFDEKSDTHASLAGQLQQLQDDIRRKKRDMEIIGAEKTDFTSKLEELDLHNETSQKELKTVTVMKQNAMVEDSILKLEVKRLGGLLNERADSVLSLERKNMELNTAMKERKSDIEIHKNTLFSQMKVVEEERRTVSTELHKRLTKIEKLKNRYEIVTVAMLPPEGEETQAFYIVKAAQEKEELQRTGDAIDAKICKAEKEIRALENTLRLLSNRNENYRKSFSKVSESSEEFAQKEELDENLRAATDNYKHKRRQIRELQEDLQTMSVTLDIAVRDEAAFRELMEEKKTKVAQLKKDLDEQATKLERVTGLIYKTTRLIRGKKNAKELTLEEKDIDVRCTRERNRNVSNEIAQAVQRYPEMSSSVEMYHQQVGLPVPSVMSGTQVSNGSSTRSSAPSTPRSTQSTYKNAHTRGPSRSQTSSSCSGTTSKQSTK